MPSFVQFFTIFAHDPLFVVAWAGVIILFFVLLLFFIAPRKNFAKSFFFISISLITIVATSYLVLETMRRINISPTKGPVHWHADFLIFNCGKEVDLIDPEGFSNRAGTPVVHEHGDKRIHIEGIPENKAIVSLQNFMHEIGGYIDSVTLRIPTNEGVVEMTNGNLCGENKGVLQAFVWTTKDIIAQQKKIESFTDYIISPFALVPPGDCVIFEFDILKERTEYICEQYIVAEQRGDITIKQP